MSNIVPFPERENPTEKAFLEFTDSIIENNEITDQDFAQLIFNMREFTNFCLAGDKNLRRLYKMLYCK